MADLKAKAKCFADYNELKEKVMALIAKNSVGHVTAYDAKSPFRKACVGTEVRLSNASLSTFKDEKISSYDSFNFISIEVLKVKSLFSLRVVISDLNCGFDSSHYYDSGEKLNMRIFTPERRNWAIEKSINIDLTYFNENTTYDKEKVFAFLEELFTKIKVYFTSFEMYQKELDAFRKEKMTIDVDYQHKLSLLRDKLDAEKAKIRKAMDIALAAANYSK